jgi:hypothetical protein
MSRQLADPLGLTGTIALAMTRWTAFGSPDSYNQMPDIHKSRILFLDKLSTHQVYEAFSKLDLLCGDDGWGNTPFNNGCFQSVVEYRIREDVDLKKWLIHLGIPYTTNVFIMPTFSARDEPAIYSTWEIVVEYSNEIFGGDNMVVVSLATDWCLHYHHDDIIKFAREHRSGK